MQQFVFGLDLGQAQDFSALAMLEQTREGPETPARYDCVHLHRWPLNTPYPKVVSDVAGMVSAPGVTDACLAIDGTGVGRPIVDLFIQANLSASIVPVLITAGHAARLAEDGYRHVSKVLLVGALRSLSDRKLLRFAKGLALAKTVEKELANFKTKITLAANETFACDWREGQHDDLVLATAIAAWVGENVHTGGWEVTTDESNRSIIESAPEGVWLDSRWPW
jgi:hypothetical protein